MRLGAGRLCWLSSVSSPYNTSKECSFATCASREKETCSSSSSSSSLLLLIAPHFSAAGCHIPAAQLGESGSFAFAFEESGLDLLEDTTTISLIGQGFPLPTAKQHSISSSLPPPPPPVDVGETAKGRRRRTEPIDDEVDASAEPSKGR